MSEPHDKPRLRLDVPVEPLGEREWERLERRIEGERERELASAPVADLRTGMRRLALVTMLTVGVAAGMALMWWKAAPDEGPPRATSEAAAPRPTRVVTPPGGASRLSLGDAVVEIGGDSELTVETAADGAITVRLAHGLVDCDVEPRPGRAPFHVVAADVVVTVVGTRFTVESSAMSGGVRVAVLRGKVRVAQAAGPLAQVAAGQEWDARHGVVATPAAEAAPVADAGPREHPAAAAVVDASPLVDPATPPAQALAEAGTVEAFDPDAAAARYAQLALVATDPAVAEQAAYRLARLELGRARWDAALAAARTYEQRFARGAHLEDVLWFRVEASCGAYRSRAADSAARAYLAKFPRGRHAPSARSTAVCAR